MCNATEKMRIELKDPNNKTIDTINGKDLVHGLIANESLKFGQYKCVFDGTWNETYIIRIPYRLCKLQLLQLYL